MVLQSKFTHFLIVGLALVAISVRGQRARLPGPKPTVFDVTQTAAPTYNPDEGEDPEGEPVACKGDGKTNCGQVIMQTWVKACQSPGPAIVRIPPGKFLTGELLFQGPCKGPVTFELQGELLSSPDASLYPNGQWILFERIEKLLVTGKGTLNGQGEKSWRFNDCKRKSICKNLLAPSIVFSKVNNSVIEGVTSLNSKGFHMKINDLTGFTVRNIKIKAPWNSPNTDGIHISGSSRVVIRDSVIGTGDDCVSIGEGTSNINVTRITCGPGHGISVGSLGYRKTDKDVVGVIVSNCTLWGTTNGARIKTWHESPKLNARSITFKDLIFSMVKNPIIIDQHYGTKKGKRGQSYVKISDVHFRNIRGTTISNNAISLLCSTAVPCTGIEVANINLTLVSKKNQTIASVCDNAQAKFMGKISPNSCGKSILNRLVIN